MFETNLAQLNLGSNVPEFPPGSLGLDGSANDWD